MARRTAELLNYSYLDSGAMYRALAWKALRERVRLDWPEAVAELARRTRIDLGEKGGNPCVRVDGEEVTGLIRSPEVAAAASKVAVIAEARKVLVEEQRRAGRGGGVVMEGRDIGTVVFPDADLKIYLEASPEVRAERRRREYLAKGEAVDAVAMLEQVAERDKRDSERAASPLKRAGDAVLIDNTAMSAEETARLIALLAKEAAE